MPSQVTYAPPLPRAEAVASIFDNDSIDPFQTASISSADRRGLAGRTLAIASVQDLNLRRGEVILTFDDGPSPTHTPKVLAALADYDVKATFFMVGTMANAHPVMARTVARAGHTVGTHTHNHEDLAKLDDGAALQAVNNGSREVSRALAPDGRKPAPFFRFPYLSHTTVLRAGVRDAGLVIFGVDVDSRDFAKDSPDAVLERTLKRLDARGRGIILFHDIHARTAAMLPDFLAALRMRGYTVVHVVPAQDGVFGEALKVALDTPDENLL